MPFKNAEKLQLLILDWMESYHGEIYNYAAEVSVFNFIKKKIACLTSNISKESIM